MRKKFGIDIDGTVTSPAALLPFINKAFGMHLTLADVKQYDLNPIVNVSKTEFANWYGQNEPQIYLESAIAQGAASVLNKWKETYELCFISARAPHLLDVTKQWFINNGLTFDQLELIGTHNKVETARRNQVDIFFEDKHDNAVMIHEECHIPVILFDTPYNQDSIPNGVIRVRNWQEADRWVENWVKEKRLV